MTLTHHPLLVPWSRKGRAIHLLPLWAVRPVQSLSACTRVTFTLLFFYFVRKFQDSRLNNCLHLPQFPSNWISLGILKPNTTNHNLSVCFININTLSHTKILPVKHHIFYYLNLYCLLHVSVILHHHLTLLTYLLTYLPTYLLHGAQSFLTH